MPVGKGAKFNTKGGSMTAAVQPHLTGIHAPKPVGCLFVRWCVHSSKLGVYTAPVTETFT